MKKKNIDFIYWFAYYNLDSPSVRYRAKYPLDYFKSRFNVESVLVMPSYSLSGIFNFFKAYFSALYFRKANSLIVIQRVQSSFIYATLLKLLVLLRKENTIYDLDDADYLEHDPKTIYFFANNCEKISAGSPEIAKHLQQFNENTRHTTSPIVDLGICKKQRNSLFTIGWIGGFEWGHRDSMVEFVFPALAQLPFPFKLVLIGVVQPVDRQLIRTFFRGNNNITIDMPENIDWNNERGIQHQIVQFDIGIATLINTPVHIAKSGIKAKQYMNNGVPVLSTNLPENNSVVVHGKNGYFCANPEEFKTRIHEFHAMDDTMYSSFSEHARASIKNFDHHQYFHDFRLI